MRAREVRRIARNEIVYSNNLLTLRKQSKSTRVDPMKPAAPVTNVRSINYCFVLSGLLAR
jgi:hypothetical protein